MQKPSVGLGDCIICGVCVEVSPEVFRLNDAGYIEVTESGTYPQDEVNEAIRYCPTDCISWQEE
ncbi:MAG: ferredoxin [Deltaproteobacteria bacterium]|nr:ferredoxin [Deltaproteobacteria bacterium]